MKCLVSVRELRRVADAFGFLRNNSDARRRFVVITGERGMGLRFHATDCEVTLEVTANCESAGVMSGGSCAVLLSDLKSVIKGGSGGESVEFIKERECEVILRRMGTTHTFTCPFDSDIAAVLPPAFGTCGDSVRVRSDVFRDALKIARTHSSNDGTRYFLTGVYLKAGDFTSRHGFGAGLRVVATDSRRLYMDTLSVLESLKTLKEKSGFAGVIIPNDAVDALVKALSSDYADDVSYVSYAFIGPDPSLASIGFRSGDVTVSTRVIDGEYPAYMQIVEQASSATRSVVFDAPALLGALKAVRPGLNPKRNAIELHTEERTVRVTAVKPRDSAYDTGAYSENVETVSEYEAVAYMPTHSVGFNVNYLTDALLAIGSNSVRMRFQDERGPGWFDNGVDGSPISLVMPCRLS